MRRRTNINLHPLLAGWLLVDDGGFSTVELSSKPRWVHQIVCTTRPAAAPLKYVEFVHVLLKCNHPPFSLIIDTIPHWNWHHASS